MPKTSIRQVLRNARAAARADRRIIAEERVSERVFRGTYRAGLNPRDARFVERELQGLEHYGRELARVEYETALGDGRN